MAAKWGEPRKPVAPDVLKYETVKPSPLFESLGENVKCLVCERKCVIRPGHRGICGTRANIRGKLYTLNYGNLSALESRPIEIKPFFHFWPGSTAMTFSTWSCNLPCPWCQNWHLSKALPEPGREKYVPPERVVDYAVRVGDEGVCASFNEPLMEFEYTLDLFRKAKQRGLYTTYVSNGYMTLGALKMLIDAGLDGLKIDIKGDERVYREVLSASVEVPWRNAEAALKMGVHVEIVYLMVTGLSDSEEVVEDVVERHLKHVGENTPLHILRYFPAYEYSEPPTPIDRIEWAWKYAQRQGIKYVYVGNVRGHPGEHTYCPRCGKPVIKRFGPYVVEYKLESDHKCVYCGERIPIRGRYVRKSPSWLALI